jgi:serine protease Do
MHADHLLGHPTRHELKPAFKKVAAKAGPSTVQVLCDGEPVALGTVVRGDGYVLTKASLLTTTGTVSCRAIDGAYRKAEWVGTNDSHDLALLKVNTQGLKPVVWREGPSPAAGSWLVATDADQAVLGAGVASTEPRKVRGARRPPRNRGFLGVQLGDAEPGARIRTVYEESAAKEAELQPEDVVVRAADKDVASSEDLVEIIGSRKPGDEVTLVVQRGGEELTVSAVLGKVPSQGRRGIDQRDRWGGGPFSERRTGFAHVISHDIPVPPELCGGPVYDIDGRCVGINVARALRVANYAVPADTARKVIEELLGDREAATSDQARTETPAPIEVAPPP